MSFYLGRWRNNSAFCVFLASLVEYCRLLCNSWIYCKKAISDINERIIFGWTNSVTMNVFTDHAPLFQLMDNKVPKCTKRKLRRDEKEEKIIPPPVKHLFKWFYLTYFFFPFNFTDLSNVTMTVHYSGKAGSTMTFYCSAVGPAVLAFSWKKDHVTLNPSYWVKIEQHNSTCSVLTIRRTKKAVSGNYTCNVRWENWITSPYQYWK